MVLIVPIECSAHFLLNSLTNKNLWGYLKGKVYKTVPNNLNEIERRITNELTALRRTRKVRVAVGAMRKRAQVCIRLNGAQVEGRAGQI